MQMTVTWRSNWCPCLRNTQLQLCSGH